jgi:hypothetical protein
MSTDPDIARVMAQRERLRLKRKPTQAEAEAARARLAAGGMSPETRANLVAEVKRETALYQEVLKSGQMTVALQKIWKRDLDRRLDVLEGRKPPRGRYVEYITVPLAGNLIVKDK